MIIPSSERHKSNRCAPCNLDLPKNGYEKCPVCGGELFPSELGVSPSHSKDIVRLKARKQRLETGSIPNAMIDIVEFRGQKWVAEELLVDNGYEPKEFDVVLIRGRFYELNGKQRDADGLTGWWLEPIDPEAEVARLTELHPVLSETEYQTLEQRRGLRE